MPSRPLTPDDLALVLSTAFIDEIEADAAVQANPSAQVALEALALFLGRTLAVIDPDAGEDRDGMWAGLMLAARAEEVRAIRLFEAEVVSRRRQ